MFRPIDFNALDREFRPGKPLSTEIRRRRIVDLYLSGDLTNSSCYLWRSVSNHSSLSNVRHKFFPLVEEDEEILLNFQVTS